MAKLIINGNDIVGEKAKELVDGWEKFNKLIHREVSEKDINGFLAFLHWFYETKNN